MEKDFTRMLAILRCDVCHTTVNVTKCGDKYKACDNPKCIRMLIDIYSWDS